MRESLEFIERKQLTILNIAEVKEQSGERPMKEHERSLLKSLREKYGK